VTGCQELLSRQDLTGGRGETLVTALQLIDEVLAKRVVLQTSTGGLAAGSVLSRTRSTTAITPAVASEATSAGSVLGTVGRAGAGADGDSDRQAWSGNACAATRNAFAIAVALANRSRGCLRERAVDQAIELDGKISSVEMKDSWFTVCRRRPRRRP
jgi:hypothetical protein